MSIEPFVALLGKSVPYIIKKFPMTRLLKWWFIKTFVEDVHTKYIFYDIHKTQSGEVHIGTVYNNMTQHRLMHHNPTYDNIYKEIESYLKNGKNLPSGGQLGLMLTDFVAKNKTAERLWIKLAVDRNWSRSDDFSHKVIHQLTIKAHNSVQKVNRCFDKRN